MYTGEKLASLSKIIYDFAKSRLAAAGLDDTLAEFVVRDVHLRFMNEAYSASLLRQLSEVSQGNGEAAGKAEEASEQTTTK